jgi:hypothetical protein
VLWGPPGLLSISPGVRRLELKALHSPSSSTDIKQRDTFIFAVAGYSDTEKESNDISKEDMELLLVVMKDELPK